MRERLESNASLPSKAPGVVFRSAAMLEMHYRVQLEAEKATIEVERVRSVWVLFIYCYIAFI
jgi:hypothetical protein